MRGPRPPARDPPDGRESASVRERRDPPTGDGGGATADGRRATVDGRHPPEERGSRASVGLSRRTVLAGASALAVSAGGGAGGLLVSTEPARADVATGGLSISGTSISTSNGKIQSLTVTISDGHASYDGLEADAASIEIHLYAADTDGGTTSAGNRIDSTTRTVSGTAGLGTRAGHADYSFVDADVLAANALAASDFEAPRDGTKDTTVHFRVELRVLDAGGTPVITGDARTTTTISVTDKGGGTGGNNPPAIDSFSVATSIQGSQTRFDVTWTVSDPDADLATVDIELIQNGTVLDSVSKNVKGQTVGGSNTLKDKGTGSYDVTLTVTDGNGNTDSQTKSVTA